MEDRMDIRALRHFLVVVGEGSISAAAERLHMSQPNLSRQISALERDLGVTLLVRGNRRVELTEEGAILRRRAEEIIQLADATREEVGRFDEDVRGTVRIAAGESDALRPVIRAARDLTDRYPNIRVSMHSGNAHDTMDLLDRGLADFGVVVEPADKTGYDFIQIPASVRWGLMVRADDSLADRGGIRPEDLTGRELIVSQQDMAINGLSGWLGRDMSGMRVVATYNLLYNASLMVSEGMGSALCLEGIVRTTDGGDLRFIPLDPPLEVGLTLIWKRPGPQGRAQRLFLEHARSSFVSMP